MNISGIKRGFIVSLILASSNAFAEKPNTTEIDRLTGLKGEYNQKEDVYKVSNPLKNGITVADVKITPPMGLSSWVAFKKSGNDTIITGDIVLLEDQVNPVMSAVLDNGLEVTALHNHFLWENPRIMFMHIGGKGNESTLAAAVGKVFDKEKETRGMSGKASGASIEPSKSTLNSANIEKALGIKGEEKDGVYRVTVGRTAKMKDFTIDGAMGVNTWAAFAGSDEKAAVDGDFVVLETELQDVLKALRTSNINITAIHNHMTLEEPRLIFLHYWGTGPAESLARGVKAALDKTKRQP